ncbi:hypothetical protein Lal_00029554 [Lupinus albus]|nr:hypothetical protein Lal_00029554 [Lupinus albus]
MARSTPIVFTIFFFVLLLLDNEMGLTMVAKASKCEGNIPNCASVCNSEAFPGGHCRGLRRRCYCTKNCPVDSNNDGSTISSS